jgi:hypothetical protein
MKSFTIRISKFKIAAYLLCCFFFSSGPNLRAQVVINENFDSYNGSLPLGWMWYNLSGSSENSNRWLDRLNTLPVPPNPSPVGHSGTNYAFYNVIGSATGEQAYLVTKAYDLSGRGASAANIRFWMYRDNASNLNDSITILAGTSPLLSSATRLGVMQRYYNYAPVAAANSWNQYTYALPAGINTSHSYIFFVGTSKVGRDVLIDDFSIDTWPTNMVYSSTTMWQQGVQIVSKASVNEAVIGICVVTNNAATPLNLYRMTFNANGSSNPAVDVVNAKLWYTGQSNNYKVTAPLTNQVGVAFSPVTTGTKISFSNAAGLITLTNDTNYFWLSYDISPGATPNGILDAEFDSVVVGTSFATSVYYAPTVATMPGSVLIDPYCIPSSSTACVACYVQGAYILGANNTKISTGSSVLALPANTGAMVNGTLYCFWNCISPPLGTTLRYKLFPPIPNQTVTLNAGNTYTLKTQFGQVTGNLGAWIDYNNDGDFDDTLFNGGIQYYERIGLKLSTGTIFTGCTGGLCNAVGGNTNSQLFTITFQVPPPGTPGLVYGSHRLRIREISLFTGTITPCTTYMHGETEDYTISVIPLCIPGLCQWLGYTDDWNTPSNWCPNVPTLGDVARIDYAYSFTPAAGYHKPVIRSGVDATCKVLRISNTDTVFINSTKYNETSGLGLVTPATLRIADSARINYNTPSGNGALNVITNNADSSQLSNGGFTFTPYTPFQTNKRNMRMQIIITKSELNAKGMIQGDIIDSLVFYLRTLSNATADSFVNFSISAANLTTPGWTWPAVPVSWAPTGPLTTIFGPTILDLRNVQPTHPNAVALPGPTAANCGQISLITIPNSFVWNGVDDIVLDFCFRNLTNSLVGVTLPAQLAQTQTTGVRRSCMVNNTSAIAASALCGGAWPAVPGTVGNIAVSSDYRFNVTFKYQRPFSQTVITMEGDSGNAGGYWVNNGNFKAGWSEVLFQGSANDQYITGANVTSFSDLSINQNASRVVMQKGVNVDSILTMTSGELTINRNLLTINRSDPSSVVRTNGWVKSEDTPPGNYSTMAWNIGIKPGTYVFPFGTNSTTYIPFKITPTGDAGLVDVATYKTPADNTPYPTASGPYGITVVHMQSQATGANVSISDVIDRFWQLNKTGATTTANLVFSYKPTAAPGGEEPASGPFVYTAQRYQVPGGTGSPFGGWQSLGGINSSGSVSVTLVSDPINGPWTLGNLANPLPIQLLNFDASLIGSKVKTYWSTASERDNDHFIVERSTDLHEYSFIASVNSQGNSSVLQNYDAWDNEPLNGLQYYRLKSVGTDGEESFSKPVPIKIDKGSLFEINFVFSNYDERNTLIKMNYNSTLPYSLRITDVLGRSIYYKENNSATDGVNFINVLPVKGIYIVTIENSQESASKKFVY